LLSEKDIISIQNRKPLNSNLANRERGTSDLLVRLDALHRAEMERFRPSLSDHGIDPSAARRASIAKAEFLRVVRRKGNADAYDRLDKEELLAALVLLAYPDRVCRRRGEGLSTARMVGGRGVRLEPESVVREAEFFIAIDPRDAVGRGVREARVRIAVAIEPSWLSELFPDAVRKIRNVGFDETQLADVVASACSNKTTLEAVRRVPLVPLLRGILGFPLSRLMDEEAPVDWLVPTGNRIRLVYEPGRPPVLAVRLQELFGLAETPKLAGGRVPVLLHLLGPNYRPVQVTSDLRSFWNTTYVQVRKDLRNKYPKHSWPEDPWNAPPVAKGRPMKP
jgi:hypothetical protein